jgi:hypothetical protein
MPARRRRLPETALPNLAARAATGNGVFRVADALAEGLTHSQIRTLVRRGILLSLGHGSLGLAAGCLGRSTCTDAVPGSIGCPATPS